MKKSLTAEKVLEHLHKDLLDLPEDEYEKLLDITSSGSENFLFLASGKVADWIESSKSQTA